MEKFVTKPNWNASLMTVLIINHTEWEAIGVKPMLFPNLTQN